MTMYNIQYYTKFFDSTFPPMLTLNVHSAPYTAVHRENKLILLLLLSDMRTSHSSNLYHFHSACWLAVVVHNSVCFEMPPNMPCCQCALRIICIMAISNYELLDMRMCCGSVEVLPPSNIHNRTYANVNAHVAIWFFFIFWLLLCERIFLLVIRNSMSIWNLLVNCEPNWICTIENGNFNFVAGLAAIDCYLFSTWIKSAK